MIMRKVLVIMCLALLAAGMTAGLAAADPAGPVVRCTLDDPRLAETSGLVDGPEGPQVVADSGNPSTVYRLDDRCGVAGERPAGVDGRDVEDLARAADGTLWLADIGDNQRTRSTVAILRLAPQGSELVTRLTYPDGPHDAESLLLPGDGRPVIVTKDPGGRSGVYTTDAPLGPAPGPVGLRRVAEVDVPAAAVTEYGAGLYTGGAISADGRVVALRTYTDAWLYAAPNGAATADDVVAALAGTPVRVPLPGEPQGEAIAFAADGTLLSAGETRENTRAALRAVPGAAALAGSVPTEAASAATPAGDPAAGPAASPAAGPATASPSGGPLLAAGLVVGGIVVLGAILLLGRAVRSRSRS